MSTETNQSNDKSIPTIPVTVPATTNTNEIVTSALTENDDDIQALQKISFSSDVETLAKHRAEEKRDALEKRLFNDKRIESINESSLLDEKKAKQRVENEKTKARLQALRKCRTPKEREVWRNEQLLNDINDGRLDSVGNSIGRMKSRLKSNPDMSKKLMSKEEYDKVNDHFKAEEDATKERKKLAKEAEKKAKKKANRKAARKQAKLAGLATTTKKEQEKVETTKATQTTIATVATVEIVETVATVGVHTGVMHNKIPK